jgi:hypothetical protein
MSDKSTSSGGVSAIGLLGILFIGLKLCNVIDWSWWWVTAPFWGPFVVVMVFIIIYGIYLWVEYARSKD